MLELCCKTLLAGVQGHSYLAAPLDEQPNSNLLKQEKKLTSDGVVPPFEVKLTWIVG